MKVLAITLAFFLKGSDAFVSPQSGTTGYQVRAAETSKKMTFLDNLPSVPNPFGSKSGMTPRIPNTPPPVSNNPEALFSRAKSIVSSDLGISDPSIIANDFQWIGPNVIATSGPLSKDEYLAAGKYFNLRSTFPDLDYRAHDFRIDPNDPLTVRFTARTVGTMRGDLRLRSETLPPNGKRMVCPPEAISMTFDGKTGKLVKLCSGFCLDRLVGNTAGLCGVQAAATVAGAPPSEWEIYPPASVIGRFFSRSVKQLDEPSEFLAPFPETVMIQLAKGVIAAEQGSKDPDLLGEDFTFCAPIVGPLGKKEFVEAFKSFNINDAFPDLEEKTTYSNFRVDPYDPYRVWFDVKGAGTRTGVFQGKEPNGAEYSGPPEASSMTFDDDGFCIRLTAGAVMDPTIGNTGGLGGVFGILYATGISLPPLVSRPLPQVISRLQKIILSPITGNDVDSLTEKATVPSIVEPTKTVIKEIPTPPKSPLDKIPAIKTPKSPIPPAPKAPISSAPKVQVPRVKAPKVDIPKFQAPKVAIPKTEKPPVKPKSAVNANMSESSSDPVSDAFSSFFGSKGPSEKGGQKNDLKLETAAKKKQATEAAKRAREEKRKAEIESAKKARAEETAKKQAEQLAAVQAKKQAASKKAAEALKAKKATSGKSEMAASKKKQEMESAKQAKVEAAAKKKQEMEAVKQARAEATEKKKQEMEAVKQARAEAATRKKQEMEAAKQARAEAAAKKKQEMEAAKQAKMEAAAKKKQDMEAAKQAQAGERKTQMKLGAQMKQKAKQEANKKEKAEALLSNKNSGTISLEKLGLGSERPGLFSSKKTSSQKTAPAGVPTINKWKKNRDGSVTGFITGSKAFEEGERVTTSKIASGQLESGSVVATTSGSKYFLK